MLELEWPPFDAGLNPDFFFMSSTHEQALSYLRYGLHMGEGVMAIAGMQGTGKSMLFNYIEPDLEAQKAQIALVDGNDVANENIFRLIATAFNVFCPQTAAEADTAKLRDTIKDFFIGKASSGTRLILVIDHAEALSITLLKGLNAITRNVQRDGKSLLQVILLGRPKLVEHLRAPALVANNKEGMSPCLLEPLTPIEMRDYIEHRLSKTNWSGEPVFTEQGLELIYHCTRGIPERVNVFCHCLLQYAEDNNKKVIYGALVKSVLNVLREQAEETWGQVKLSGVRPVKLAPIPNRRGNRAEGEGGDASSENLSAWVNKERKPAPAKAAPQAKGSLEAASQAALKIAKEATHEREEKRLKELRERAKQARAEQAKPAVPILITPLESFEREEKSDLPALFDDLPHMRAPGKSLLVGVGVVVIGLLSIATFFVGKEYQQPLSEWVASLTAEDEPAPAEVVLAEAVLGKTERPAVAAESEPDQPAPVVTPKAPEPPAKKEVVAKASAPASAVKSEPKPGPKAEPVKQIVAKSAPVAKPVEKPKAAVVKPVDKPKAAVVKPEVKKEVAVAPKQVAKVEPKPVVKQEAVKPAPKPALKSTPTPAPVVKAAPKPAVKPVPKPQAKPKTEVAKAAKPKPAAPVLSKDEQSGIQKIVDTFAKAYNDGKIGNIIMSLTNDVQVDNSKGKYQVSQAYMNLLQTTESRNLSYQSIQWDKKGETYVGRGLFENVVQRTGSSPRKSQGRVAIELVKTSSGFRISKIDHIEKR